MKFRKFVLISALFAPAAAFAQTPFDIVSFGVTGGVGLTDALAGTSQTGPGQTLRSYSSRKDYIVGPSLEVHLPLGFSVEADALYRSLSRTEAVTISSGTFTNSFDSHLWEFPVLAKYRLGTPIIKPFIEAGPSFRHVMNGAHFSSAGATAGVGVELKFMHVRIAPTIRYTHWGSDTDLNTSTIERSRTNQVEMLLGLSF